MREIKFRVWDDYLQVMRGHTDPSTIQAVIFHQQLKKGDTGRYVIEQYTGLLDKNGKEIYEGDMVEYPTDYFIMSKQAVIYSEGYFVPLVQIEHGYNAIDDYRANEFEIIGNIHGNPELIN